MTTFLILLGVLVALLLIRASSLSSNFQIKRSIALARPLSDVFSYTAQLKNHSYFNKWIMTDPHVVLNYTGTDATVGFSCHWMSAVKNVGEGIQTITELVPNEHIAYTLQFIKPFADTATATLEFKALSASTCEVSFSFSGKRTFIHKLMHVLFNLPKMLGNDLSISLENLKLVIEK